MSKEKEVRCRKEEKQVVPDDNIPYLSHTSDTNPNFGQTGAILWHSSQRPTEPSIVKVKVCKSTEDLLVQYAG